MSSESVSQGVETGRTTDVPGASTAPTASEASTPGASAATSTAPDPAGREGVRLARRLVVKVGSSSLTDAQGLLDRDRLRRISDALAQRRRGGTDVVLVSRLRLRSVQSDAPIWRTLRTG